MSTQAGRGRKFGDARSPQNNQPSSFASDDSVPAPGFLDTKRIAFQIPGPPVGKGRPRAALLRNRRGIVLYTPARTRAYEQTIRSEFSRAYPDMKPWLGPVSILVKAYVRTPAARPDGSNILKAVEDALNGLAYKDDSQVVDARVVKVKAESPAQWLAIHAEELI